MRCFVVGNNNRLSSPWVCITDSSCSTSRYGGMASKSIGIACAILVSTVLLQQAAADPASKVDILTQLRHAANPPSFERDILVLYTFRPEDAQPLHSLQFFVEHAVKHDFGRGQYLILVPRNGTEVRSQGCVPSVRMGMGSPGEQPRVHA